MWRILQSYQLVTFCLSDLYIFYYKCSGLNLFISLDIIGLTDLDIIIARNSTQLSQNGIYFNRLDSPIIVYTSTENM